MVIQIILEVIIILIGVSGMIAHSGLISGEIRRDFFRYYTNLSNLLVVMFYLSRTVVRIMGSYDGFFGKIVFSELWFYSVTMVIFLTFGIFHFVLAPSLRKASPESAGYKLMHSYSNYFVHYLVPLLALLNWLIFADKTAFSWTWGLIWTLIPWIYVIFAMVMGALGKTIERTDSAYPYDFMDAGKHGWGIAIRNCLLVTVVFLTIGFAFLGLRSLI